MGPDEIGMASILADRAEGRVDGRPADLVLLGHRSLIAPML
jgi:hypothetical protein